MNDKVEAIILKMVEIEKRSSYTIKGVSAAVLAAGVLISDAIEDNSEIGMKRKFWTSIAEESKKMEDESE